MDAIIYCRVSSDRNGLGRSVTEQQADCEQVCHREGWNVAGVLVDNDRSASRYSRTERPAYRQLADTIAAGGVGVLVVWEASRAQRDLAAYVQLRDLCRDAGVLWSYSGRTYDLSRTDDAFQTGLDALLAERESSQTRDRVLRAVRANAEAGRPHGKLCYGYRRVYDPDTGRLASEEPHPEQAPVVREVYDRVLAGETTYGIAKDLDRRGVPTPRGGPFWYPMQVKRLVANPKYAGRRVWRGEVVGVGIWPPLVSDDVWERAVGKLTDPARGGQRDSRAKHLLSSIARCGCCSSTVRVIDNRGTVSYACGRCLKVSRVKRRVDEVVSKAVVGWLTDPDKGQRVPDDASGERDQARDELAGLRARLDALVDQAASGGLSARSLARAEARLLPQIEAAERTVLRASGTPAASGLAGPDGEAAWGAASLEVRREVVRELLTVTILPVGSGRRTFDPASVDLTWLA